MALTKVEFFQQKFDFRCSVHPTANGLINPASVICADCLLGWRRNGGQSTDPLEIDRPWDAYADDQLGVMDHMGIDKFMVLGFCIGGPFIWSLLKRTPNRIVRSRASAAQRFAS